MMKIRFIALALSAAVLCTGCSWLGFGGAEREKPAIELVEDGVEAYNKGNFTEAIKNFEQLKDWYPFSKYAILAELKIADAHYYSADYDEAVAAYEEFERLHPRNEATPYVIYQTGRCHYDRIDSIDRDQNPAKNALEVFQRLVRQHPDDPYARKAQTHIAKCLQNIAGHHFYVGKFYLKSKHYRAALNRFMMVVTQHPDVGLHHKALDYIAQCEALVARQNELNASDDPEMSASGKTKSSTSN